MSSTRKTRKRRRDEEEGDDGVEVGGGEEVPETPSEENGRKASAEGHATPAKDPESAPRRKKQKAVKTGGWIERLEVENFKSYKGHQVIGPFKQFQCIIGPNGAGKSNLMDAISFVLGITTRQLRSTQLRDLVHKGEGEGASKKKAFVQLVFKLLQPASDADAEIAFKRTIMANGSSEYRINTKVVQWEEYNDSLRDLGVLVKARNFLVFQGDVEQIAQKSPKDLTALFETISGSEELKGEYEKAEKDKNEAEQTTIFTFKKKKGITVEKKQYKQQKEEADKFEEMQRELLKKRLDHVLFQLFRVAQEYERVQESLEKDKKEDKKREKRQKTIQESLQAKKKEQGAHQKEVLQIDGNIAKKKKAIAKKKPAHIQLKADIDHLKKRISKARKDLASKEGEYEKQQEALKELEDMLKKVNKTAADFEKELKKSAKGGDLTFLEGQMAEYNACKEQAAKATAAERQQREQLLRDQENDKTKLENLNKKLDDFAERLSNIDKNVEETTDRQTKVQAYIDANQTELATLKAKYDEIVAQNRLDKERQKEVAEKLRKVTEKLSEARSDQKQNERDAKMNEALENMKRLYPGVIGKITDLCKPVQKKYNTAVSVALGKSMDAIVTDTEATARECVDYLRENRVGKCTFIPLDAIRVKPPQERLRQLGGSLKLMVDLVQFDPAHTRAFQHALGETLYCDSLEEARPVAYVRDDPKKIVTQNGTKISKAGLMTGGSDAGFDKKSNVWEEHAVESLRKDKDKFQKELFQLGKRRKQEAEENELSAQITGLETRLKHSHTDLNVTSEKIAGFESQRNAIQKEREKIEPEMEALTDAIASREKELGQLETKINKVEDKIFKAFSESVGVSNIREYEETRLKAAQEQSKRRLELAKQRDKLQNQLEYERTHDLEGPLAALRAAIEADDERLKELHKEDEANTDEMEVMAGELKELEKEHKERKKVVDDMEVEIKEIKKNNEAALKDVMELQKKLMQHESMLDQLRSKRHSLFQRCIVDEIKVPLKGGKELQDVVNVGAGRGDSQSQSQGAENSEKAAEAYKAEDSVEVDFEGLHEDLTAEFTQGEYDKIDAEFIESFKNMANEIDRMAPNLKALDRLGDVTNRLKDTGEEFETARKLSREATQRFEDVKRRRTERFNVAFKHIAEVIDDIYKKLTSDEDLGLKGQAFLSLDNEDEPYLGGLKYTAMPPSKRFREMTQLSGGEKTVAALALLFAIHTFRPSPFFVLDEVDAALDNANVNRISNYIRKSSSEFQCIVISLKDSFYDKADALVGIYRDQARGCSATMTLDLLQFPEGRPEGEDGAVADEE